MIRSSFIFLALACSYLYSSTFLAPVVGHPASVTVLSPQRTLGTAFQLSATKVYWVSYVVEITCAAASGQTGTVELRSDGNPVPTTVRAQAHSSYSASVPASVKITNTQKVQLSYVVPIGDYVSLVKSGTCGISLLNQTETLFN